MACPPPPLPQLHSNQHLAQERSYSYPIVTPELDLLAFHDTLRHTTMQTRMKVS